MTNGGESWFLSGKRRPKGRKIRTWILIAAPAAAVLFQVYAPLIAGVFSYLELPLLVLIYLAMNRRSPVAGLLIGMATGIFQDALSHWPIGLFGMVKTLVGFAAASAGVRFDTDNPLVRFLLGSVFYLGHQAVLWGLKRVLLNEPAALAAGAHLIAALVNGGLALLLFHLLDKLRENR